jgi:D-glycero-D-manno-heptose 1,7-bisphosphate phosphatase
MSGRPALFLDRDGVVFRALVRDGKPYCAQSVAELTMLPGVVDALQKTRTLGMLNIVVTNQPDVARGTLAREVVEHMHAIMRLVLPIDDVMVCYHDDADGCACRKPKPGMLLEAAQRHGVDLARSYMVGDRWRDVEAGRAAGCVAIWMPGNYGETAPRGPVITCHSLLDAVDWM